MLPVCVNLNPRYNCVSRVVLADRLTELALHSHNSTLRLKHQKQLLVFCVRPAQQNKRRCSTFIYIQTHIWTSHAKRSRATVSLEAG